VATLLDLLQMVGIE